MDNKSSNVKIENVNPNQLTILSFERNIHQFGKIKEGEIVGCYFKFKNEGEFPLIIHSVKPSCGCTAVDYSKIPILPNQSSEIEVRFDTRGFTGNQYKVISVYANIKNEVKELVISANVIN